MAQEEYPPQKPKKDDVKAALLTLARSKVKQEVIACRIAEAASSPIRRQIAEAVGKSNRLMAEDLLREAGYLLPQSGNVSGILSTSHLQCTKAAYRSMRISVCSLGPFFFVQMTMHDLLRPKAIPSSFP